MVSSRTINNDSDRRWLQSHQRAGQRIPGEVRITAGIEIPDITGARATIGANGGLTRMREWIARKTEASVIIGRTTALGAGSAFVASRHRIIDARGRRVTLASRLIALFVSAAGNCRTRTGDARVARFGLPKQLASVSSTIPTPSSWLPWRP